jgi:hypothetical protein
MAQRLAASGVLARHNFDGGGGDLGPLPAELNTRVSFLPLMGGAMEQQWKGLARGGTAAGVSFVAGRPTFRANLSGGSPLPLPPPPLLHSKDHSNGTCDETLHTSDSFTDDQAD